MVSTFAHILILALFLIGIGCHSNSGWEDEEYIGPNGEFFHAKIDGKDWYPIDELPSGEISLMYSLWQPGLGGKYFQLDVRAGLSPSGSELSVFIDQVNGIGSYTLSDTSSHVWAAFYDTNLSSVFYTDSGHVGSLEITRVDSARGLIWGKVSFDATNGISVIKLRDGEFLANIHL